MNFAAAFAAPVTDIFQRAVHLIDKGFIHSEAGNLYRDVDGVIMSTEAPFERVDILTKSTPTTRMSIACADIIWG